MKQVVMLHLSTDFQQKIKRIFRQRVMCAERLLQFTDQLLFLLLIFDKKKCLCINFITNIIKINKIKQITNSIFRSEM
jgi:hypothetical protein